MARATRRAARRMPQGLLGLELVFSFWSSIPAFLPPGESAAYTFSLEQMNAYPVLQSALQNATRVELLELSHRSEVCAAARGALTRRPDCG